VQGPGGVARMKLRVALVLAGAAGMLLALGLVGAALLTPEQPPSPAWLDFAPNIAQRREIEQLRSALRPGDTRFPQSELRERENAKLFMYLAGTSDDQAVVLASLDAIQSAYSSRSGKKEAPDRDLERVLLKHLESADPARAQAAFAAARIPLMTEQAGGEILGELVRISEAGSTPGLRWAALEALNLLPPTRRSAPVLQAFLSGAAAEPGIALAALLGLSASERSLRAAPDLRQAALARVQALATAEDPGIRGTALQVLVELDPAALDDVSTMARTAVADPHPYVRAQGAWALGTRGIGDEGDIHLLMPLIDDLGEARAVVRGPHGLDGRELETPRKARGGRFVAEVALLAVKALAMRRSPAGTDPNDLVQSEVRPPPRLTIGSRTSGIEQVKESAASMRFWYETERDDLAPRHSLAK
jgi:hypothetical protein